MSRIFDVRDPRTGRIDHRFEAPSAEELAATLQGLRAAQPAWAAAPLAHRIEVLARWRAEWLARQQDIVAALAADTGRHLLAQSEFQSVLGMIDRWSRQVPGLAQEED
jgi:acyl-CoA reductase-like NAD-dependent aldehyde dehydrogenase